MSDEREADRKLDRALVDAGMMPLAEYVEKYGEGPKMNVDPNQLRAGAEILVRAKVRLLASFVPKETTDGK